MNGAVPLLDPWAGRAVLNRDDRIVFRRQQVRLRLVFLHRPMVRIRSIFDFDFLENAVAASLPLRRRSQLMMAQEVLFVPHEKVVGHPEQQHIDEEWNDQHHNDQLQLGILERRKNQILHLVPVVHLDYQRRQQLHDNHQENVNPRLVDPRPGGAVLAEVDRLPLFGFRKICTNPYAYINYE